MFVHPGKLLETAWIDDANATFEEWGTDEDEGDEDGAGESEEEVDSAGTEWNPRLAPTQVQMVEILQFFNEVSERRFRIVLVISAWDLVTENPTPGQWLEERLPLLWQFLTANPDRFDVTYMGVSAQGGEVEGKHSQVAGFSITTSRRTGFACAPDKECHDISLPIRWLMSV